MRKAFSYLLQDKELQNSANAKERKKEGGARFFKLRAPLDEEIDSSFQEIDLRLESDSFCR